MTPLTTMFQLNIMLCRNIPLRQLCSITLTPQTVECSQPARLSLQDVAEDHIPEELKCTLPLLLSRSPKMSKMVIPKPYALNVLML